MTFRTLLLALTLSGAAAHTPLLAQDAQTKLWDASIAGDTAAIAQALGAGANIDSLDTRRSVNGRRPLNWAAYNNRVAAVQMLIARGAKINATNLTGFTPVHHAAETGAADALKALLQAGADITIPNNAGLLPVDTAKERGNVDVAQLLEAAARKPQ